MKVGKVLLLFGATLVLSMWFALGCRQEITEKSYPLLALSSAHLQEYPDSVLYGYEMIATSTSIRGMNDILVRASRTERGKTWSANVKRLANMVPLTSHYYEEDGWPRWKSWLVGIEPEATIEWFAYANLYHRDESGRLDPADWFLRTIDGEPICVWGTHKFQLNCSATCEQGKVGESKGLTYAEYMTQKWPRFFEEPSQFRAVYDGILIEDGPMRNGIATWVVDPGERIMVNGQEMTDQEFSAWNEPYFNAFIRECFGQIMLGGTWVMSNGHHCYDVCEWQEPWPGLTMWVNGTKMESPGNWGGCPGYGNYREWGLAYLCMERLYRKQVPIDGVEIEPDGWNASIVQCLPSKHWAKDRIRHWQRFWLSLCLMGDAYFTLGWHEDAYGYRHEWHEMPEHAPEVDFQLGVPLDRFRLYPKYVPVRTYYRRFVNEKGIVHTVVFNPNVIEIDGATAEDGSWFRGEWPDGKYTRLFSDGDLMPRRTDRHRAR